MFRDHAVPSGTNSMEMELDKYLSLCRQSKTHDLLQWCSANCSAFSVLAWPSRKWMSAVSTGMSLECLFSQAGSTVTARRASLKDNHVKMFTFIHDNLKYTL